MKTVRAVIHDAIVDDMRELLGRPDAALKGLATRIVDIPLLAELIEEAEGNHAINIAKMMTGQLPPTTAPVSEAVLARALGIADFDVRPNPEADTMFDRDTAQPWPKVKAVRKVKPKRAKPFTHAATKSWENF